jgi:hypothetical protein
MQIGHDPEDWAGKPVIGIGGVLHSGDTGILHNLFQLSFAP